MKQYKVLETHIGDDPHNPYVPGDETYGTRTMPATDAKELIDLGLLEEIDDESKSDEPQAGADVKTKPTTKGK
jgi:hypothetical protein